MKSTESGGSGDALEIFAGWLTRREQGQASEFAALLREHPELESDLQQLHATWQRLAAASEPSQASLSLHERIRRRFGAESLPEVSLPNREQPESSHAFQSALISKLASHDKNFARYQIRGEVARGGMGAILKIWDEELRRNLAMKVILGQAEVRASGTTPPLDSSKIARFLEEAQITGQLDHPGIVPVHELGLDPSGRLYFTMKLVKGESLHTIFEHVRDAKQGWTQTRALGVLLKVCEAMAYAHDKGVIHRDLKPANVMVGKFGEVHVMDWGLAHISGQKDRKDIRIRDRHSPPGEAREVLSGHAEEVPESPLCTMDGDVVGTPTYMPPEQAAGKRDEVGPHSDVYALGAMLYHLIVGHPPYLERGLRHNAHELWVRVQAGPPGKLERLAPEAPAELAAICERAMARDWKLRYRDMSELAADLSAYLNQRVVHAYETGAWAESRKWMQRNRGLAAALAGAILILIAGVVTSSIFGRRANGKAAEAEAARKALSLKNRELENSNLALSAATAAAETSAREATRQKRDVLKLSAFQDVERLELRADELWPARPERIADYRMWIEDADRLLGRLPELRASLAEIEGRALPQTDEERAMERAAHPRAGELEQKRATALWTSRMLSRTPWPSVAETQAQLAQENLPSDSKALLALALKLLDPQKPVFGSEVRALLLVQRALDAASPEQKAVVRTTLAQAYTRVGEFDKAIAEARQATLDGDVARKQAFLEFQGRLEGFVSLWRDENGEFQQAQVLTAERIAREVAELEVLVARRRQWRFEEDAPGVLAGDSWWHEQLQELVAALELFGDAEVGLAHGLSNAHGLGIARRLELASSIVERSQTGEEASRLWSAAIEAIAQSKAYAGVQWPSGERLLAQLGLLPLGPDPDSGLWEFADLQTGEVPVRDEHGKLHMTAESCLVFVLLPGGKFWMGAQSSQPLSGNYDPNASSDESPVHEVQLSPCLFSKYEMTQGQWLRIGGSNPSQMNPDDMQAGQHFDLRHPVERVSWHDCETMRLRLGLELPSESQWEYACRAGTDTPWWTGVDVASLEGKANLADQSARRATMKWFEDEAWPDIDDGCPLHAPVGSFAPNPFGLHDIIGNVWEWCAGGLENYTIPNQVDPSYSWLGEGNDLAGRGGGFGDLAVLLRSAHRDANAPDNRSGNLGLRPARKLSR